jgi:hypothetical protein
MFTREIFSEFDAAIYKMFNHEVDLVLRKSPLFLLLTLLLLLLLDAKRASAGAE